jgi:hypothetical protein
LPGATVITAEFHTLHMARPRWLDSRDFPLADFLSDIFVWGALGYSISRFTVLRQWSAVSIPAAFRSATE